ncbi:hypothetical protein KL930_000983 [Ogataea haglerorum]|nr:hypothetical protein KL951_000410 [Ogataea haglerorum]KAG7712539.1 hypothetical protein KL950_000410 [Ogataea haglerorum]KAG7751219.1 hypothetical protein KL912_000352 [Ogataea haglerorum]KAG7772069.1 hypothetical protein KL931_000409 [Ogataea haglerorum]KAG7782521.1 hypothetical protein KL930_000983 [Ogataea haglerorum]
MNRVLRLAPGAARRCVGSVRFSGTLRRPDFDLEYYSSRVDLFRDICSRRQVPFPLDGYTALYGKYLDARKEAIELKREANTLQQQIKASKAGKQPVDEHAVLGRLAQLKPLLKQSAETQKGLVAQMEELVGQLPNLIDDAVGSQPALLEYINVSRDVDAAADEKFDHKSILESAGLAEFLQASNVSGRGWYYLMGDLALLEQALVQYSLKMARKSGFQMVLPPSIVKTEVTNACGFRPRDTNNERQVYELTHDNLCLTGTAEISLAALSINAEYKFGDLPRRTVGLSRSFRAEAGAAGRDTRGLYRVHEFTKVELFSWTAGELSESSKEFDRLVAFQKEFISNLGLPARVLLMPADDLGAPAFKKVDIEVFMPGRGAWGEVSSTSNCLDYQARRLHARYRTENNKLRFVHTLNGTACAVPRLLVAIVENNYDPDSRSIAVPEVLQPYMDDKKYIDCLPCK